MNPVQTAATDLSAKAGLTSGRNTWHTKPFGASIPALVTSDGPHGLRHQGGDGDNLGIGTSTPSTCYPTAAALASSWDTGLLAEVGRALGREARALGVHVLLGPGLNIRRSPLCGRNFEYFSEDPHLTGRLGAAMVSGIQSQGVAATPKHFAVNNQETDRMRISADLDERTLREIYLPAFEQVVRTARPWALMAAYNRINGTYASEARWLLTDILRQEWGFDGVVVSDWGAVNDRAAALAAGLDLEMPFSGTDEQVVEAVTAGALDEGVLDEVVQRMTRLASRVDRSPAEPVDADEHHQLARRAAAESIVLLKNQGSALPLAPSTDSVLVVGDLARAPRIQGGGSSRVVPTRVDTAWDALQEHFPGRLTFAQGFGEGDGDPHLAAEAVAQARLAQVTVVFLGLPAAAESEGFDRTDLDLPAAQTELLAQLAQTGTTVVAVLTNGGVVDVASWQEHADAVVETWLAGQGGGAAVADVLTGVVNPSGRLTETVPVRLQDTPAYLTFPGRDGHVLYGEAGFVGYRYYQTQGVPVAYPFGFGLSYTTFSHSGLQVDRQGRNRWRVRLTVTNTGPRPGAEVVQLYLAPASGDLHPAGGGPGAGLRPRRELRDFTKVQLQPGESRQVELEVDERAVSTWDARYHRWRVDAGEVTVEIGTSARDIVLTETITVEPDGFVPELTEASTVGEWLDHPSGGPLLRGLLTPLREGAGASAPELLPLLLQLPVVKLLTWPVGLTADRLTEMCDQANGR